MKYEKLFEALKENAPPHIQKHLGQTRFTFTLREFAYIMQCMSSSLGPSDPGFKTLLLKAMLRGDNAETEKQLLETLHVAYKHIETLIIQRIKRSPDMSIEEVLNVVGAQINADYKKANGL